MNLSMDPSGNIYVADAANHVVRMITPASVTTTLAGKPGISGYAEGNGSSARFNAPAQVLYWDPNTLYVVEYGNHALRRLDKQLDGTWTTSLAAGTPTATPPYGDATTQSLDNPMSLLAWRGRIIFTDGYTSVIRVFDPLAAAGNKIQTIAGKNTSGTPYFGYVDGAGATARFRTPSGIAVEDVDANNCIIYVADRENHAIRKVLVTSSGSAGAYTYTTTVSTIAGADPVLSGSNYVGTPGYQDGPSNSARFNRPVGIVRDSSGNLFVADEANHAIRMISNVSTTRDVTTIAGSGTAGYADGTGANAVFNGPEGLTIDASGNLYVADALNNHIRMLTPSGSPATYTSSSFSGSRLAGLVNTSPATSARFMSPNGVAIDKDGNIYVADEGNKVVRKIATNGTVSTWGTGVTFTAPYALCVDDSYNVYVLDRQATTAAVVKINASGAMSTLTLSAVSPALGTNCRGIAISKDGSSLYVANGTNIHRFNASGAQVNVLSTGLYSVNGIAVATDGVYWVDYSHHIIKKAAADLTGSIIVAGTDSTIYGFVDGAATTTARFKQPVALALAVDSTTGNATKIYVVDQGNHALRMVDIGTATVTTVVGIIDSSVTGGVPGRLGAVQGTLADQPSSTSGLYYPKGVGIHPTTGDLYVSTSDGIMQVVPLP